MSNRAMIAFLPSNVSWCKQDLAHMTLVDAGDIDDLQSSDFNALAKDTLNVCRVTGSFVLPVVGIEEFGSENDKVDVLTFHPNPQLLVARKMVEKWNKSGYADFKPHATIGPVGSASSMVDPYADEYKRREESFPIQLYFNRIGAFWGNQSLMFSLDY